MELRLSYRAYRRTFLRPLRTAHGEWTHREGFILRVDAGGGTAYGEVAPLPDFGTETLSEADALLARLAETPDMELPAAHPCCAFALSAAKRSLIARDARAAEPRARNDAAEVPSKVRGKRNADIPVRQQQSCEQGADPTPQDRNVLPPQKRQDAASKTEQARSLNWTQAAASAARPVAGLLPGGSSALASAAAKLAAGYRSLKWKIGVLAVEEEIALGAELLGIVPRDVKVRLDGNGGLSLDALARWLDFLSGFSDRVEFIEQPLPPGAEATMAAMGASAGVPIALDESLNGSGGGQWLQPGAWAGPLVIKPLLMGDLSALEARLRPVATQLVYSSVFETVFGLCQALDLVGQLPASPYALGFDTAAAFDDPLSPGFAGPRLDMGQPTTINLDQIWNRLPHLT